MTSIDEVSRVIAVGVAATMVMDVWTAALKGLGVPTLDYALVGRWAGHLRHGRLAHASIGKATPIHGELPLGWVIHYAVGIVFATLLIGICGIGWLRDPLLGPALAMGLGTVAIPLFVMQPAMGAGIASSRMPTPVKNVLRSLATHAVFGCGLYLSAAGLNLIWT